MQHLQLQGLWCTKVSCFFCLFFTCTCFSSSSCNYYFLLRLSLTNIGGSCGSCSRSCCTISGSQNRRKRRVYHLHGRTKRSSLLQVWSHRYVKRNVSPRIFVDSLYSLLLVLCPGHDGKAVSHLPGDDLGCGEDL